MLAVVVAVASMVVSAVVAKKVARFSADQAKAREQADFVRNKRNKAFDQLKTGFSKLEKSVGSLIIPGSQNPNDYDKLRDDAEAITANADFLKDMETVRSIARLAGSGAVRRDLTEIQKDVNALSSALIALQRQWLFSDTPDFNQHLQEHIDAATDAKARLIISINSMVTFLEEMSEL